MLIPKKDRDTVYKYLMDEGVLVAKKDFNAPRHTDLNVPNLYVLKSMQSLESRGYVKSQFSWQYFYYTLTEEGVNFLREYLHLPTTIVPKTQTPKQRPPQPDRPPRTFGDRADRGGAPRERGGAPDGGRREEYRRAGGEGKESGPSGNYTPRFGGVGRGAPMSQRS